MYTKLINQGFDVVKGLTYGAERKKVEGYMYSGSAVLQKDNVKIFLSLWWHGPDEVTYQKIEENLGIRAIEISGKYYDLYWHSRTIGNTLWIHPEGWFRNNELREKVNGYKNFTEDELKNLGFFLVLSY